METSSIRALQELRAIRSVSPRQRPLVAAATGLAMISST
jgi:hypothetical protein